MTHTPRSLALFVLSLMVVFVSVSVSAGEAGADEADVKPKRIIHGKPENRRAVEALLEESEGDAEVETTETRVFRLKGKFKIDKNKPVEDAALDFIERHRDAFGLKDPKRELVQKGEKVKYGANFQQVYNGVPIWQKGFGVRLNINGEIVGMGSNTVPTPDIDTTPLITADEAVEIATADKIAIEGGTIYRPISALYIYNNKLAYDVHFLYRSHGWRYFIDAKSGIILDKCDITSYDGMVDATGTRYTGTPSTGGTATVTLKPLNFPFTSPPRADIITILQKS